MTLTLVTGEVFRKLVVRSLDVDEKELTWELAETHADALDYQVEILRSESPLGPYEVISPAFTDRYMFVDRRIPIGDKFRVLYYKLRVTNTTTGDVVEVGPAAQSADADLTATAIRRLEMTFFTQVIGRACWLFKKRTFGPRCQNCWNAKLQKRVVDRCLDCFGTGVLRGYHNPIEVWAQVDPAPKAQQNAQEQIAQHIRTTGRMSFYPNVSPGDVLVEAENRRWRVQSVSQSERLRATVKQELSLRQLEETDIEFRLPINLDRALRDIQPSPKRMFENATDLNSAIENRTSDVFDTFMTYPSRDPKDV